MPPGHFAPKAPAPASEKQMRHRLAEVWRKNKRIARRPRNVWVRSVGDVAPKAWTYSAQGPSLSRPTRCGLTVRGAAACSGRPTRSRRGTGDGPRDVVVLETSVAQVRRLGPHAARPHAAPPVWLPAPRNGGRPVHRAQNLSPEGGVVLGRLCRPPHCPQGRAVRPDLAKRLGQAQAKGGVRPRAGRGRAGEPGAAESSEEQPIGGKGKSHHRPPFFPLSPISSRSWRRMSPMRTSLR